MRITRIQIKVRNVMDYPQKVNLLDGELNLCAHNNNLPDGVITSTRISYTNDRVKKTYDDFLQSIVSSPKTVSVLHTTNPRQLNFFNRRGNGDLVPLMPLLTLEKVLRQTQVLYGAIPGVNYTTFPDEKWDPEIWNIADTAERFMLDGSLLIELNLLPKQEFNIFLSVKNLVQIDKEITA